MGGRDGGVFNFAVVALLDDFKACLKTKTV